MVSLALAVALLGCGGADRSTTASNPSAPRTSLPSNQVEGSSIPAGGPGKGRSRIRPPRSTRKVVQTGEDGMIILPKVPQETRIVPGRRCVAGANGSGDAPPRPGVQAATAGDEVLVEYAFPRQVARSCRPELLLVTVASADGTPPPTTTRHAIRRLRGLLRIQIPKGASRPPDVVTVSAATSAGRRSASASVAIP